MSTYCFHWRG